MTAKLIKFADSPPGLGGEFEKEVMKGLRESLSENVLILGNPSIVQNSFFYEYDVIVAGASFCDVLEVKCMRSEAKVGEVP